MTIQQARRTVQRDEDHALYHWQSAIDLATRVNKTRLTIYRWVRAGYVERKYLSRRSILVRLRAGVDVNALPAPGDTARTKAARTRARARAGRGGRG